MRVVFAGTPETAVPSLHAILASKHEVLAVLTRPDARAGRGRHVAPSPVAEVADEAGIETLKPAKPSDPDFQRRLAEIAPDCAPVVAYGGLIPRSALEIPRHGWVNLHFSLLPAWRGAAPVQRSVLAGDEITGASTFLIEEGLDTGPMFGVVTETVDPRDTSGDLLQRLSESGAELLVRTLDGIEDGTVRAESQSADGITHAPKMTAEDAQINWSEPAIGIDRRVRACTPAPGAWTMFRGARLKVGPVVPLAAQDNGLTPGELRVEKSRVLAGTGGGVVELGEIQAQGKRAMRAADWARGMRPEPGERLGDAPA